MTAWRLTTACFGCCLDHRKDQITSPSTPLYSKRRLFIWCVCCMFCLSRRKNTRFCVRVIIRAHLRLCVSCRLTDCHQTMEDEYVYFCWNRMLHLLGDLEDITQPAVYHEAVKGIGLLTKSFIQICTASDPGPTKVRGDLCLHVWPRVLVCCESRIRNLYIHLYMFMFTFSCIVIVVCDACLASTAA